MSILRESHDGQATTHLAPTDVNQRDQTPPSWLQYVRMKLGHKT